MDNINKENVSYVQQFDDIVPYLEQYNNILLVCGDGVESRYGSAIYRFLKKSLNNSIVNSINIPGDESAKNMRVISIL